MMYKVFLRYPEALRPAFPKLKEKLEDPDPGVQSAAVNVICELARKNPKNYLSLAPIFFKLMTTSTNNWMLIKIIKLVSNGRSFNSSVEKVENRLYDNYISCQVWNTYNNRASLGIQIVSATDCYHCKVLETLLLNPRFE